LTAEESEMADHISCDGCGKMSPDENMCYIANGWTTVTLEWGSIFFNNKKKLIYCEDCLPNEAKRGKSFLKRFISIFRKEQP